MINKYQGDLQKTWRIMKEIIGKCKNVSNTLPRRIVIENQDLYESEIIAEKINNFFVNVGPQPQKYQYLQPKMLNRT